MKKMSKFYVCLLTMIAFPIGLASCGNNNISSSSFIDTSSGTSSSSTSTNVEKLDYDMSNVKFEDKTVTYDGNEHTLEITGTLPEGVSVSYTNNKLTEVGSIEATATFVGDYENYNEIPNMTATLTIALPQDSEGNYIINGIKYKDNGETIDVIGYTDNINHDAFIMNEILGKPVIFIGESAFSGCTNLTSINIPDSVTSISDSAFQECYSLTSVAIPNSVTFIGYGVFFGCFNLTSVAIPDNVTSISDSAFAGCSSLTSIVIPDSVTSISDSAFAGCSSLISITIPDSVTFIGDDAFYRCNNLTDVYYSGTQEQWNNISLGSGNDYLESATIHFSN